MLTRIDWMEDRWVKYTLRNDDESVIVTLVNDNKFNDEMTIRVIDDGERYEVRGHKSIMDNWSFGDFEHRVEKILEIHRELR